MVDVFHFNQEQLDFIIKTLHGVDIYTEVMNGTRSLPLKFAVDIPQGFFQFEYDEANRMLTTTVNNKVYYITAMQETELSGEDHWKLVRVGGPHVIKHRLNLDQNALNKYCAGWNAFYFMLQKFFIEYRPEVFKTRKQNILSVVGRDKRVYVEKKHQATLCTVRYIEDFSSHKRESITFKCPCWTVVGHKRHLKDGRVIFVKPYRKGKHRNDDSMLVGKDYLMN